MSALDFDDPIYRVSPPLPEPQPEPQPAFDPTANPIWGPLFTDERQPRGYRVRSEEVWVKAKDEYLRGFSAEAVCAEFGLGLSTFRQRARREGWRRSDVSDGFGAEDAGPETMSFPPEPEAAPPTDELADLAWRAMAQAIRRGRVYEARAWMKLVDMLRGELRHEQAAVRLAARRTEAALADVGAEDAEAEDTGAENAELHGLHCEEGVQSDEDDDADGPPSRADCAALMDALQAEAERGGHIPEFAAALLEVRSVIAAAANSRPP